MAVVFFYEKTGCVNNTKQRRLLNDAGHHVVAINLLKVNWRPEVLRPFFGEMPVRDWFNFTAPQVKNGEIDPDSLTEAQALDAMVRNPILIRRPLMQIGNQRVVGFDEQRLQQMLSGIEPIEEDLESCPREAGHNCDSEKRAYA